MKELKKQELKVLSIIDNLKNKKGLIESSKITGKQLSVLYGYNGSNTSMFNKIKELLINKNILTKLNDEFYQLNIENLEQEQLSQESNISTQDNNKVSQIEEKVDLNENVKFNPIKENFKEYIDEILANDILYNKVKFKNEFNKALSLVNNYNYSTEQAKKLINLYYKNKLGEPNNKIYALLTLIVETINVYDNLDFMVKYNPNIDINKLFIDNQ